MTYTLHVKPSITVERVKKALQEREGYYSDLRLMLRGEQMWDGRTLGSYDICDGDQLDMMVCQSGC